MPELDPFETRLAGAVGAFADRAATAVDAAEVVRRAAGPERRIRTWGGRPVPAFAWILLALLALLVGLLGGAALAGPWRPYPVVVVGPTPTANASPDEGTDVLATTKARPLPAQATCPDGSTPDALGPADQARPVAHETMERAMAFDRQSGRIVLLAQPYVVGSRTWTYDVCTNTWHRMAPSLEPPSQLATSPAWLAYDADSDRTVAFVHTSLHHVQAWSYDLETDRWTRGSDSPEITDGIGGYGIGGYGVAYHDRSGLVVLYDGTSMLAYDVDSDTWTTVRQRPDPARPAGAALPWIVDALAYDSRLDLFVGYAHSAPGEQEQPETWTFDPRTGTWRQEPSVVTPQDLNLGPWGTSGSAVAFDETSGLTVFTGMDGNQVVAYQAGQRTWSTLHFVLLNQAEAFDWCDSQTPVYDPLNGRIVCRAGGSGVAFFSSSTGQWQWLLKPEPGSAASPTP